MRVEGLNRTSVGLKDARSEGGFEGWGQPQSNQRGIESNCEHV